MRPLKNQVMKKMKRDNNDVVLFESTRSFVFRFLGTVSLPMVLLTVWYLLGRGDFFVGQIIIAIVVVYIFFSAFKQNQKYITKVSFDKHSGLVSIKVKDVLQLDEKKIELPLKEILLKQERLSSSIYKHYKLVFYTKEQFVIEQQAVGEWTYKRMTQLREEIDLVTRS